MAIPPPINPSSLTRHSSRSGGKNLWWMQSWARFSYAKGFLHDLWSRRTWTTVSHNSQKRRMIERGLELLHVQHIHCKTLSLCLCVCVWHLMIHSDLIESIYADVFLYNRLWVTHFNGSPSIKTYLNTLSWIVRCSLAPNLTLNVQTFSSKRHFIKRCR